MSEPIVVDSNIIAGVSRESAGLHHAMTASPTEAIDSVRSRDMWVCLDEQKYLEHEWRSVTDPDWFENWFLAFVAATDVRYVRSQTCRLEIKRLCEKEGFPRTRDTRVLKLVLTTARDDGGAVLLSEDVDFFHPAAKARAKQRARLLEGREAGGVARTLKKSYGVAVKSVRIFLDS